MVKKKAKKSKVRSKKASSTDWKAFVWGIQAAVVVTGLVNLTDYFEIQQGRHRLERISSAYLSPEFQSHATFPDSKVKMESCGRTFDCFLSELKSTRSLLVDSKTLAWVVNVGHVVASRKSASEERAKLDTIEVVLWSLRKFHEQPKVSDYSLRFVWKRERALQKRYLEDQWMVLTRLWQGFGVPERGLASGDGRRPAVTVDVQGNFRERKERLLAETRELQGFQAY